MPDEEKTKPFQFRNIPGNLHFRWKLLAMIDGQTMEEFGLEAIKIHILDRQEVQKKELAEAALAISQDESSE